MIRNAIILLTMMNFLSSKPTQNLSTVEKVDIKKYAGQWYEIARLPNSFEKGLHCVTATYTLKKNDKIEVLNKGYSINDTGKFNTAKGTAWVPNSEYPGRLKVRFFWPFSGNYYIISLDEEYKYALVGDPSRKYLWILSRTKELDDKVYSDLLEIAKINGFDIDNLIKVNQDCP
jgi:apolipoprotein D and lipocalin family protein